MMFYICLVTFLVILSSYLYVQTQVLKLFDLSYKELGRILVYGARNDDEAHKLLFCSLRIEEKSKFPRIRNFTWNLLNICICMQGIRGCYRALFW